MQEVAKLMSETTCALVLFRGVLRSHLEITLIAELGDSIGNGVVEASV